MPQTQPALATDVELISSWFGIELDNKIEGFFTSVSGLAIEIGVVEATDSNKDTTSRKRPGTAKYNEINLKRTLTPDKSFWDWAKKIRNGEKEYRTNGAIVMYDMSGTEIGRWSFTNAWPSKWSASDLDVGTDDLMQEDITLQVELLTRDK